MISDKDLFLIGSVVSFIVLCGFYVYLRAAFQHRASKDHAGTQQVRPVNRGPQTSRHMHAHARW